MPPKKKRGKKLTTGAALERMVQAVNSRLRYGEDFLDVCDRNITIGAEEDEGSAAVARADLEGAADLQSSAEERATTNEQKLVLALMEEDEDLAVAIVRAGVDVQYRFEYSHIPAHTPNIEWPHRPWLDATLLHAAVLAGQRRTVDALLAAGGDVFATSRLFGCSHVFEQRLLPSQPVVAEYSVLELALAMRDEHTVKVIRGKALQAYGHVERGPPAHEHPWREPVSEPATPTTLARKRTGAKKRSPSRGKTKRS